MGVKETDEIMEVFCPGCGQTIKCKSVGGIPGISVYFYEGKCDECEKPVFVEDRASYEQEGAVEIIFK